MSGRPRRIALFTETFLPRVDGIVNTLKWTLRGLVEFGCEPMVIAPAGNTQGIDGVRVLGAPSVVFPLYREVRLAYPTPDIWRQIDAFDPDIVHLAGPVTNGFGGLKYAQARHLPVVSTYHTALPRYAQLYGLGWLTDWAWTSLRDIHNSTAATLCPSRSTIAELHEHGFERLRLWARGVDSSLFRARAADPAMRLRLGAAEGELLVLYVGRIAREKRLDLFANALRSISGIHVALVGDGPDRGRLSGLLTDLPATFAGVLRGEELAAAYAAADVFAFPSDTDTFGNVVLEAMASGLPVVACSVGGQVDLVTEGQSGLLFARSAVDQFVAHLERYRDDPGLRVRHGAAGLEVARERTWPRQVERLLEHYAAAAAEPAPRGLVAAARPARPG
jgi:glycosyltransferase involved in cell wall biosynthesis